MSTYEHMLADYVTTWAATDAVRLSELLQGQPQTAPRMQAALRFQLVTFLRINQALGGRI